MFGGEPSAVGFCSMLNRETRPAFVEDIPPEGLQLYHAASALEFPEFARHQGRSVHVRWVDDNAQVVDLLRAIDALSGECISAAYYVASDELSADEEEIEDDGFYLGKNGSFVQVPGPHIEVDALDSDVVAQILYQLLS